MQDQPIAGQLSRLDVRELACGRLFDEVPCYISIQNRDFKIVEANHKFEKEFGERIGEYCYKVYKGTDRVCPDCPVEVTFQDGREHTREVVVFDRKGLPHDMMVNTKPLRDNKGDIVAVMELFTDITVTKELQKRLNDSLVRYHTLFDRVPCFVSVQDRDLRIMEANQLFEHNFGDRRGELCYKVYKEREEPCEECPVQKTFDDDMVHSSEEVVVSGGGREMHVIVYTSPIKNTDGETVAVMEMLTDITEVRRLQEELARVGKLVASAAHGAKNVIDGLRGGVYVLNLGLRDKDQESIDTGWDMVKRNVDRVSAMVMDMLYCAKKRTPRRLEVSIPEIADEVAQLYAKRAEERNVKLINEVGNAGSIIGDPKDIHSMLANLVTNAIDACTEVEEPDREFKVVLRAGRENGHVTLEVEDNGVGISDEARKKLFNMFYSTKGAFGTGFGLLVAHKVATEHDGNIEVNSERGKGTKFTVTLPVGNKEEIEQESR